MELVSPAEYADSYGWSQRGRGLPVFKGSPYQRGHGFGGILSSLFRLAIPIGKAAIKSGIRTLPGIAKAGGRALAKNAMRTAIPAIKKNAPKLLKQALKAGLQSGITSAADKLTGTEKQTARKRKPARDVGARKKGRKETIKDPRRSAPVHSRRKAAKRRTSRPKQKFDDIFD